jgi:hypothetical protein
MGASIGTIPQSRVGRGKVGNIIMRQRKWIKALDQAASKRYEEARIVSMETECASFVQTIIVATWNRKF